MNEVDTDARPHHCVTVYQSVRYSPVSNKLQSLGTVNNFYLYRMVSYDI